jgi:FtsH-binding integral membrane protein
MKKFSKAAKILIIILAIITIVAIVNLCYAISTAGAIIPAVGIVLFSAGVFGFTISTAIKEAKRKESEEAVDDDSYDDDDEEF